MKSEVYSRGNSHARHMSALPTSLSSTGSAPPRSVSPELGPHEEDVIEPLSRRRGRLRISKKVRRWRQRRKSYGVVKAAPDANPEGAKSDSETVSDGVTKINLTSEGITGAGYLSDPSHSFMGSLGSSGSVGKLGGSVSDVMSDVEDHSSRRRHHPSRSPSGTKKHRPRLRRTKKTKKKKKSKKHVPQPSVDETLPASLLNMTPMESAVLSAAEAEAEAEAGEESAGGFGDDEESDVVLTLPRSTRQNVRFRDIRYVSSVVQHACRVLCFVEDGLADCSLRFCFRPVNTTSSVEQ